MLIIICGLPGVGKTYFAERLVKNLKAEYLSSDSIRMREIPERTYSQEEKDKVYELMAKEAKKLLEQEKDIILDATFYLEKYRHAMKEIAAKQNAQFLIIECILDESELKERMEKRRKEKTKSEADFGVYEKVKTEFESIKSDHLTIDTSIPIENNVNKAIAWMRNK
jgi:predicted kinase